MSDSAFATGWHVLSGTLGTDVVINDLETLSGNASIFFPNTATASAVVVSDWIAIDDSVASGHIECSPLWYAARGHFYASSISPGERLWFGLEQANQDRSVVTEEPIWDGLILTAATTWKTIGATFKLGSADSRWVRFKLYRPTLQAFRLHCDSVSLQPLPPALRITTVETDPLPVLPFHRPWTRVPLTLLSYRQQITYDAGTFTAHIAQPGLYSLTGAVSTLEQVPANSVFSIRLGYQRDAKVGAPATVPRYTVQSLINPVTYNPIDIEIGLAVSTAQFFSADSSYGDVVAYGPGTVWLDEAQPRGTLTNYNYAELTITRIRG